MSTLSAREGSAKTDPGTRGGHSLSARDVESLILSHSWEEEDPNMVWIPSQTSDGWYKPGYWEQKGTNTYTEELHWHGIWGGAYNLPISVPGLGEVDVVATHGGEGQGDQAWVVISVTDEFGDVKLYRKDGYYTSYEGADLDGDLRQVIAKEKTVTVYE